MTKLKFLLVLSLVFLIPYSVAAFSWKSLMFWEKQKTETPAQKLAQFDTKQQSETLAKMTLWQDAFKTKKWDKLLKNPDNFTVSDTEVNYLIQEEIKKDNHSPLESIYVAFNANKITIDGLLIKPIKAKFQLVGRIDSNGKTLKPVIEKVRFKGIPFPKGYANKFLDEYFPDIGAFLYSYPQYQTITATIDKGNLKLEYK